MKETIDSTISMKICIFDYVDWLWIAFKFAFNLSVNLKSIKKQSILAFKVIRKNFDCSIVDFCVPSK